MATIFSRIIAGEIPGRFVWSDDLCVAFLSTGPHTEGHALVVPRAEVDNVLDADEELVAHLAVVARRIGAAQRAATGAPRAMIVVAGFEVPHLHVHVYPAWDETVLDPAVARSDVPDEEMDAAAERLRAAIRETGFPANVPAEPGTSPTV
ncbi:HIT family protein [Georgenia sp. Z1491]|uniref:HIT family protein n=1 Tax=Georgenia sp. Z1491 TaxID=3416707 RepID=UPI003CF8DA33